MGRNEFRLSDAAEYFSGRATINVPFSCAVKKPVYIAMNQETIAKMDAKIKEHEEFLAGCENKKSHEYEKTAKRLAICQRIKRDCMDSIERTKKQIEIEHRSYHR